MDKKSFGDCLYRWSKELLEVLEIKLPQINIDGKVLCATAKSGSKKSGICILKAWVSEHCLVLGQEKVGSKTNEKAAISEMLKSLDLAGALVTCDAAGCQLKNADIIIEKQGHYLLAIKWDYKHIYEQISERLAKTRLLPKHEHMTSEVVVSKRGFVMLKIICNYLTI